MWQIFNVLAGNSDGHSKNLSLLYSGNNQTRLAPFYDLVCTRAIDRIDDSLAFSVGDERNPSMIHQKHWAAEAVLCGIRPKFLQSLVKDTARQLLDSLLQAKTKFETRYGEYAALQRVEHVIRRQCNRILDEE